MGTPVLDARSLSRTSNDSMRGAKLDIPYGGDRACEDTSIWKSITGCSSAREKPPLTGAMSPGSLKDNIQQTLQVMRAVDERHTHSNEEIKDFLNKFQEEQAMHRNNIKENIDTCLTDLLRNIDNKLSIFQTLWELQQHEQQIKMSQMLCKQSRCQCGAQPGVAQLDAETACETPIDYGVDSKAELVNSLDEEVKLFMVEAAVQTLDVSFYTPPGSGNVCQVLVNPVLTGDPGSNLLNNKDTVPLEVQTQILETTEAVPADFDFNTPELGKACRSASVDKQRSLAKGYQVSHVAEHGKVCSNVHDATAWAMLLGWVRYLDFDLRENEQFSKENLNSPHTHATRLHYSAFYNIFSVIVNISNCVIVAIETNTVLAYSLQQAAFLE